MELIYSAGSQGWKVRLVQAIVVLIAPVALWGGWEIARTYGLHPSEGGELAPLPLRLAIGGFVALIGVGAVVGMWIYGRCYVMRAEVDEARGVLSITLAGFPIPLRREIAITDIEGSRWHAGQSRGTGVSVNAPWTSVRLRGRWLPLVVDAQGESLRPELVNRYLLGIRHPRRAVRAR